MPDALRKVVQRAEITRSLRTRCPKEARKQARLAWLATERAFEIMARTPSLTAQHARLIIDRLISEPLLNSPTADDLVDDLTRFDGSGAGIARLLFNREAVDVVMGLPESQQQTVAQHMRLITERAEVLIARMGQAVARDRADLARLDAAAEAARADEADAALAKSKMAAEVAEAVNARLAEISAGAKPAPLTPAAVPEVPPVAPVAGPAPMPAEQPLVAGKGAKKPAGKPVFSSFTDTFSAWRIDEKGSTHGVLNQDLGTVRRFAEVCGDRLVDSYDRGDVTKFLGRMRRMPALYGRSPEDKELTVDQLIARADAE
ncbi:MAG: DUF6538 domain-containing protein, partial [Rhodopila sp.]